jgi:hypothetical protein
MAVIDDTELVSVLEASSEMEAMTIKAFLETQGIGAAIRSRQIPMYNGIARVWNPIWGYVMVMKPDQQKAEDLILEYIESLNDDPGTEEED